MSTCFQATMIILVVSSLLVTSRQYIGDPIDCIVDADIPQNVRTAFRYLHYLHTYLSTISRLWTPTAGSTPPSPSRTV